MSEMLSQEEIDALLRGDSGDSAQDDTVLSAPEVSLSPEEIDALGEIGNISMGTSATTLFTLLNNKVSITTPKVSITTWDDLAAEYDKPYVAVQVQYTHGLEGTNLLVLKERDVRIITDLMMGGSGDDSGEEISDLNLSAIGEAMNQMIGSSSTSLATMFNKKIDISPPRAFVISFADDTKSNIGGLDPIEKIVKISFKMEVGDVIDSEIMQILPIDFAKDLVSNLYSSMRGTSSPEPTPVTPPPSAPPIIEIPITKVAEQHQQAPQHQHQQAPQPQHQQAPQPQYRQATPPQYQQSQPQYEMRMPEARIQQEEPRMVNVQPVHYQNFEAGDAWSPEKESMELIMDVPLEITVELGRTKKYIKDILEFSPGTILELDKLAGEPVDILVNGKYIAKGEVVVIDESFGVRITDIISTAKRIKIH